MRTVTIKPAPQGRILDGDGKPVPRLVRKPNGAPLAAEGEPVKLDTYWRRRLAHGDVVEVKVEALKRKKE